MARLLRGYGADWLRLKHHTGETANAWCLMGVKEDDISYELNPDSEDGKDVTGSSYSLLKGYNPSASYNYVCDSEDSIYPALKAIVDDLAKDDDAIVFEILHADLTDEVCNAKGAAQALTGTGWQSEGNVIVNSIGGDTSGYHINFDFKENTSKRVKGTVSIATTTGQPTLTPASGNGG